MKVKLYSSKRGELFLHETIPPNAINLALPGATCKVVTSSNNDYFFLIQEFEEEGIKVRLYNFFSCEKESFTLFSDAMTTFRLAYSRSHEFHLPQLRKQYFFERNYNIFHTPLSSAEFTIGPNETFAFFDILLSSEYLQQFEKVFPDCTDFLKKIQQNIPAKLYWHNQVATIEMMRWADDLIQWNYTNCRDRMPLSSIVFELLLQGFQAFKQKPVKGVIKLDQQDIEKIYRITELLTQTDKKYSLQELSDKFNISTYKLDKGFKQIYRHSLLRHRNEEKMRLALRLVHDKQHSIKQVAYMLHYHPQNFIRAFKKRFGYTPGQSAKQLSVNQHLYSIQNANVA